jgi:hypothetical protein
MNRTTILVVCALAFALCTGSALASTYPPPPDTLKVDYFANANTAGAPDATLRVTDPNTNGGNICASIFVFDANQEMSECCSCLLTPDGLRTLSINTDITGNPLTGVTLTTGAIKVVSTRPSRSGTCPLPVYVNAAAAIRAWATHIQDSNFAVTETGSQDATLSSAEIASLASECSGIKSVGSGKGICTCGTGD